MKRYKRECDRTSPRGCSHAKKLREDHMPVVVNMGSSKSASKKYPVFGKQKSNPKYHDVVSHYLTEVLKDLGVNENIVRRRRRTQMFEEIVTTVVNETVGENHSVYIFGSQSEGSTTLGMNSDRDMLMLHHSYNVMQTVDDWKPGFINLLMLQDDDTPPGYCRLQLFSDEGPFPVNEIPNACFDVDDKGNIVLNNTLIQADDPTVAAYERHGPSWARHRQGFRDHDYVFSIQSQSWRPGDKWKYNKEAFTSDLTPDLCQSDATKNGCILVPVGSKTGYQEHREWRISTSLVERFLMFSLNITQLHCYILMKFILKTFINPVCGDVISSFMCKTTLLHCVNQAPKYVWRTDNLLACFAYCLSTLRLFTVFNYCPHFVLPVNNLMAGRLASWTRRRILFVLDTLLNDDWRFLLEIKLDDVGFNLGVKLSMIPELGHCGVSKYDMRNICEVLVIDTAQFLSELKMSILFDTSSQNEGGTLDYLKNVIQKLTDRCTHANRLERQGLAHILKRLYTVLGSVLASQDIKQNVPISQEALDFFNKGLDSDAISGRLKLASAYFCAGDFEKAESLLTDVESRYNLDIVEPICQCFDRTRKMSRQGFVDLCTGSHLDALNAATAFCVSFIQSERYCVPIELQYEYVRSSNQHMFHSNPEKKLYWMNWAVVDSLPFLYFLQYKTYDKLGKRDKMNDTSLKYFKALGKELNFGHKETDWNLIGQLMERDFGFLTAEKCYKASLEERPECNAANEHINRLGLKCLEAHYATCEYVPCCS